MGKHSEQRDRHRQGRADERTQDTRKLRLAAIALLEEREVRDAPDEALAFSSSSTATL